MDADTFEQLAASLRRSLNRRTLGGMAAGLAVTIGLEQAGAKKKKKKGKKKPVPTTAPPTPATSTTPSPSPTCTPQCSGKMCGPDGCGGACGSCGPNATCNGAGQCRVPGNYSLARTWGTTREGDYFFHYQVALAQDARGNVYVGALSDDRVRIYSPEGVFITEFGSGGTGDGQFTEITGLAVDADGSVIVVDGYAPRIQKFKPNAQNPLQYDFVCKWGSQGTTPGSFRRPSRIAIASNGDVYITDSLLKLLQKFRPDASGTVYTLVGSVSSTSENVAVDHDDDVYVSTAAKFQVLSSDLTLVKERSWSISLPGTSTTSIAVDEHGDIFLLTNRRVHKFDAEGQLITTINNVIPGWPAGFPSQVTAPQDFIVTDDGRVLVLAKQEGGDGLTYVGEFVPPETARTAPATRPADARPGRRQDTRRKARRHAGKRTGRHRRQGNRAS